MSNHQEPKNSLLLQLVAFRIVSVFLVKASFVPDEYWQGLEVAHHSAFGYGYLTWEWSHGLRSYFYPSIFTVIYQLLKNFHLDSVEMLIYFPRIMQAFFSGLSDWYFYKFAKEHFGVSIAKYSLFSLLCSWFWWYCATRTLVNSLECSALCIGIYYYPWKLDCRSRNRTIYFQIIAIAMSVIRPTAAVIWIPLAVLHIFANRFKQSLFVRYTTLSLIVLLFSTLIDYYFYQRFVLVLWNFFSFNFLKNLGMHYGSHPWHWYVTQGVPVVLGTQLLFLVIGVVNISKLLLDKHQSKICKVLLLLFTVTCFSYSFVGHKEFRFILHLVPIGSLFCGVVISKLSETGKRYAITYLLLTNIPVALYTGLIHQVGPLKIMEDLGNRLRSSCAPDCSGQVLFLMPCHTTPMYSHLHVNVSMRFIECLPNFDEKGDYRDESDIFYSNPKSWLNKNIFREGNLSTDQFYWILIFDTFFYELKNYEPLKNYKVCGISFHTHFPEGRTGRNIYLLCRH